MKSRKKQPKIEKKRDFTCAYCGNTVSKRKSLSWHGARICRLHFCDICKLAIHPKHAKVVVLNSGEIVTRCRIHKCRLCGDWVHSNDLPLTHLRLCDVECKNHHCHICGKFLMGKDDSKTVAGKRVCLSHSTPAGKKERCKLNNTRRSGTQLHTKGTTAK